MKKTKLITAALSALTALSVLSVPAAAKLEVVESEYVGYEDINNIPETWLTSSVQSWLVNVTIAKNALINDAAKVEFIVSLAGNTEQYDADKASGFFSDGETAFVDFQGSIGISAETWKAYEYSALEETAGDSANAAITDLGDHRYSFSADLTDNRATAPDREVQLSFNDWSSGTEDYWLRVDELLVWDDNGNVLVHFDGNGAPDFDYTVPEAAAEETPEETTTAAETEAPAPEETTTAETTTAAAAATQAATTAGQSGTVQSAAADFGSRDSSLVIVGIVAGVIIIAVIVVLVMIMLKKKK